MQSLVSVIMGSTSDWETMQHACEQLELLEIPFEKSCFRPSHTR